MANLNTAVRYIPGRSRNKDHIVDLTPTLGRKDNAAFFAHVSGQLAVLAQTPGPAETTFDAGGVASIGLIGEYGLIGYGIRTAEELVRVDHTPSHWSHAFLVVDPLPTDPALLRGATTSPWIWESTLEPAAPFNHFVDRNGVAPRRLSDYARSSFTLFAPHSVPNVALITIALTRDERRAIIARANDPDVDQLHYDLSGLLGTWYAYLTDRSTQQNPLAAGQALYCSAYVQLAYDAVGIDLAPGAHQRNTSPEHLWQSACYLADSFRVLQADGSLVPRPVRAWYCLRDKACVIAPVDHEAPQRLTDLISAFTGTARS